ncbi:MAG: hypothetical protein Q8T13_03745 [Acidobacteriota bacterium]|nr:hypothetical protein [Acidobacteriota bacterium]
MLADRRRLLMGGGVVLVLALGVWFQSRPEPAAAPVAGARAQAARPAAGEAAEAPRPVALDTLAAERGEPSGTARNPFRFQPRVAPAPPRAVASPETEVTRPVAPPAPAGPPPPPPIPLKFIALVERANGVKWAVLSDGKVTMYGKDGDTIDGRYRIVKIGAESVEVTHLDGRGRQVIRLTGQ